LSHNVYFENRVLINNHWS